jgi:signal transduction histidine kinase/HAMP domain-containing protein
MSLKTRLRLSIAALVVGTVVVLSVLNLLSVADANFQDVPERATAAALQVQTMLIQRIDEQTAGRPQPYDLEEIVAQDSELPRLLTDTLATSRTIIEIDILGRTKQVLASSDPLRVGKPFQKVPSLEEWARKSRWAQLFEVLTKRQNYESSIRVGEDTPIFQITVLVHSVLLRNTVMQQVRSLAVVFLISLGAAILLAVIASNIAFRPLAKISEAIDRIARGEVSREPPPEEKESKEYAVVQSKLNVLGQQFRGAKEDVVQLRGNIEQLLERLEEAVLLFDHNDRLIMAGRAAESILDRGRWELIGRTLEELFPPSTDLGSVVQGAVQFRKSLKDHPLTLERDGQAIMRLLVNVEVLEAFPSHERLGTLVTLRDAETRRQIESQLDISTRLAAISRLTGGVAHEIKNPLNAIALHLEVLKARLAEEEPEIEQEIEIISSEITRLDRVVKTFLDFNRPVDLRLSNVDLGQLATEVTTLVQPEAKKQNVAVAVEAEPEVFTRADRDLLKQAVLNVVANGVESMKQGGEVKIHIQRIGEDSVVVISDQGSGIPPEIREKIFNLYFTTKGKGSGIGLAMTFRIVQLHNGTIDFASESGKGTTFWLRFPAAEREPETPTSAAANRSGIKATSE